MYFGTATQTSVQRIYIFYARYLSNLKETVPHFATLFAYCGVNVVLDQFNDVESADCLTAFADEHFAGRRYVAVVLSPKYPLILCSDAERVLAGTEDFMLPFYEAQHLQSSAISGHENSIVPVYFGYGACPPAYIPLLLKNTPVSTISPQCDQNDKGLPNLAYLYEGNMLTSSL